LKKLTIKITVIVTIPIMGILILALNYYVRIQVNSMAMWAGNQKCETRYLSALHGFPHTWSLSKCYHTNT